MIKKVEGYALETEIGDYLRLEQVHHFYIEVYTTDSPDHATLWGTHEEAYDEGLAIHGKRDRKWKYQILDEDKPFTIVKITKLVHVEEVSRFVLGDQN